jgi:hypothetical protein
MYSNFKNENTCFVVAPKERKLSILVGLMLVGLFSPGELKA